MLGKIASHRWRLGPRTHAFTRERGLAVTAADGVVLRHDHYRPRTDDALPTILVRTPYDRADFLARFWYRRFAERGYHVIVQDCRGRCGSGGAFDPFADEREDGLATIAWICAQPWFDGRLGMWGASYCGFAQWAVADSPALRAIAPLNCGSDFQPVFHPGGTLALELLLSWVLFTDGAVDVGGRMLPAVRRLARAVRRHARARWTLAPAGALDVDTVGERVDFFQQACAELPPAHPYWAARRHSARVPATTASVHLMSGWYDVMLPETLHDYRRLRAAGKRPELTLGPFSHSEMPTQVHTLQLGLEWFARHLKGAAPASPRPPVHVYFTGLEQWRDLPDWPPASAPRTYFLGPDAALGPAPADGSTRYRYDPADPTPNLGGALLFGAPVHDNRPLEARGDVRTFTSEPLGEPLEVAGAPRVVVFVRCDLPHFDIFARINEVEASGRSRNRCDAIVRITPDHGERRADGCVRVELELSAIAHRFAAGHRIRLLLASGAHPRFARNPGTGEPALTATRMCAAEVELCHDAARPSALVLPVCA